MDNASSAARQLGAQAYTGPALKKGARRSRVLSLSAMTRGKNVTFRVCCPRDFRPPGGLLPGRPPGGLAVTPWVLSEETGAGAKSGGCGVVVCVARATSTVEGKELAPGGPPALKSFGKWV